MKLVVNLKMVKSNIIIFLLVFLISLGVVSALDCTSVGCDNNNVCYNYGELLEANSNLYCDSNGSFVAQKNIGAVCSNNFECSSGYCLSDRCANVSNILSQYASLFANLSALASGPCSASPGCLNTSSLANAHNLTNLCSGTQLGYVCYQCNENYNWTGSSCTKMNCTSSPGCLNKSSLDNSYKIDRVCPTNYQCFSCDSSYAWNSSSSACEYYPDSSGVVGGGYARVLTNAELTNGFTGELRLGWVYKFYFLGTYYYITVTSLSSNQMTIRITPRTKTLTFNIGEEKKVDLNNDDTYDLSIKLNSIQNRIASVTLKFISESINNPLLNTGNPPDDTTPIEVNNDESSEGLITIIVVIVIAIIIILIIIALIFLFRSRRNLQTQ